MAHVQLNNKVCVCACTTLPFYWCFTTFITLSRRISLFYCSLLSFVQVGKIYNQRCVYGFFIFLWVLCVDVWISNSMWPACADCEGLYDCVESHVCFCITTRSCPQCPTRTQTLDLSKKKCDLYQHLAKFMVITNLVLNM